MDCLPQVVCGPKNFVGVDDRRRSNQQVVTGKSIHASLHGIDEQTASETCLANKSGKILRDRKGGLCFFIGYEFYCPEQPEAANVAHNVKIEKPFEPVLQCRPCRAGRA